MLTAPKITWSILGLILFTGHVGSVQYKNTISYTALARCDDFSDSHIIGEKKELFINHLDDEAVATANEYLLSKADKRNPHYNDLSDIMATRCNENSAEDRIRHMNIAFNIRLKQTKTMKERNALFSAYSAWKNFIRSPSDDSGRSFESKLTAYKKL